MVEFTAQMSVEELIDEILSLRGIKGDERSVFLNPDYEDTLHDPFLLADMQKAIERIEEAINKSQSIFIYGDYDIDGLSATALLSDGLSSFGAKVSAYIPDRFKEGYGINQSALETIKKKGGDLVITVDCGSTALKEVDWANENGLDVIVTDHHSVPETLPEAVAVVNPKRKDQKYPFKDLAGVGVAFKLVQALQQKRDGLPEGHEKWLLDLVALGTVCDIVDLRDENRTFVKYGLLVLEKTKRAGLKALIDVCGMDKPYSTTDLGFRIGPRLNASGRMEHAQKSLDVLTAENDSRARGLALELNETNQERKTDQSQIYKSAKLQAEEQAENNVLVLAHEDWSQGINGIVASKIVEKYHKPTFIMQKLGEKSKGSARSFGDFIIIDALRYCDDLLETYGGHDFAGGFTVKTENISKFEEKLNEFYDSLQLKEQEEHIKVKGEIVVDSLAVLSEEVIDAIDELAPFGRANERPIFSGNLEISDSRKVGSEGRHLQLNVCDKNGNSMRCISFGASDKELAIGESHKIWFHPQINEFNGRRNLQLQVLDFKPIKD